MGFKMFESFQKRTIVLFILCLIILILNSIFLTLGIFFYHSIFLDALIYIVGFIITIIGIYNKHKYGFILAIIFSAIGLIISLLVSFIMFTILELIDLTIFLITLIISIMEIVDYEKNYQTNIDQKATKKITQKQYYSPPIYQQSIQDEKPKFCPNCGEAADGQYCRVCGEKIDT